MHSRILGCVCKRRLKFIEGRGVDDCELTQHNAPYQQVTRDGVFPIGPIPPTATRIPRCARSACPKREALRARCKPNILRRTGVKFAQNCYYHFGVLRRTATGLWYQRLLLRRVFTARFNAFILVELRQFFDNFISCDYEDCQHDLSANILEPNLNHLLNNSDSTVTVPPN